MTRRPWLARKWKICGLLFLATTLNYLDRQTLSIPAPILREDMHLDNERLGWLFAVFFYAYTLCHFGVGPILDSIASAVGVRHCRARLVDGVNADGFRRWLCQFDALSPCAGRDGIGELARSHPHHRSYLSARCRWTDRSRC